MKKLKSLYRQIKSTAISQEYLELGMVDHMGLTYPMQLLTIEDWEKLHEIVPSLTEDERQVVIDALLIIKNNKNANYDTSSIYAEIFISSDIKTAETMLESFDFIDNDISKPIELIDGLMHKLEILEQQVKRKRDFSPQYELINKLYLNAIC